jgi:small-conductance mechanosensitive channel
MLATQVLPNGNTMSVPISGNPTNGQISSKVVLLVIGTLVGLACAFFAGWYKDSSRLLTLLLLAVLISSTMIVYSMISLVKTLKRVLKHSAAEATMQKEAEVRCPSRDKLRELVKANRPPKEWYEEDWSGL